MQQAVKTLPSTYTPGGTLDLSKDPKALIGLNIVGLGIFFVVGWASLLLTAAVRPDGTGFSARGPEVLWLALGLLVVTGIQVVIHELIHGLFFWYFTHERPTFGFKGLYAYAAAPDWYLPRNEYLLVGLAPLVLMTLGGFLLLLVIPTPAIPLLLFAVVSNIAGAVGDMAVVVWLLRQPGTTLVRDIGDAITFYRPDIGGLSSTH